MSCHNDRRRLAAHGRPHPRAVFLLSDAQERISESRTDTIIAALCPHVRVPGSACAPLLPFPLDCVRFLDALRFSEWSPSTGVSFHVCHIRNPPPNSGFKKVPYKKIPELIGRLELPVKTIEKSVSRFQQERKQRGRPVGWKKTTDGQDKVMLQTFHRVRKPLGSLCESMDIWTALPKPLRDKVLVTHVSHGLYGNMFHHCS